jgi:ABC-2 type transport system ATP-binding protein
VSEAAVVPASATSDALVRVEGLSRRFGAIQAVEGVSFEVRRGEMFGLIGPDGAGKTTTLRTLLGLLRPDAGSVRSCGLDPLRERRLLSAKVGYLSQRFSLYGDLSVDENVAFFAEIHDISGYAARRESLLEMVRMTPFRDRLADRLSGGMKQKLALVCTLVHTPELLVLDEPTTGVDPVSRRDFWRLLARLQREGLTIVLTTPYLDEAEALAARLRAAGLVVHSSRPTVPSLEDVFIGRIRARAAQAPPEVNA